MAVISGDASLGSATTVLVNSNSRIYVYNYKIISSHARLREST